MKKLAIIILTVMLVGCNYLFKDDSKSDYKAYQDKEFDEGSKIEISHITDELVQDLYLLGKIWGFLKYHHPEIAKGNYNWDYELFRFLPEYIKLSGEEKDKKLIKWIDSFGLVFSTLHVDSEAYLEPDLNWINGIANLKLKRKLLNIFKNRNKGKHFYIKMAKYIGNPEFQNENSYTHMSYPDDGFRILALYRYWNMINYFFPYKHLIDKDWDKVLKEYIPIFLDADCELEYEMAALQIIGEVKDTHANLRGGNNKIEEWKGIYFPPVHVRFIEDKLVVTDYYNPELKPQAELEVGDIITEIDGMTIEEIVEKCTKYYPASNQAARLRDMACDILRSPETEVNISYLHSGVKRSKDLRLYHRDSLNRYRWYRKDDKKCYKLLENDIGYITLKSIKNADIPKIKKQFKDTKGIVIDIRNYPSCFVPFKLGSYFISESTPFVKFTVGSMETPGKFSFTKSLQIHRAGDSYKGKLVVLVNELTQSQAEYTSMAFRAGDNTTIIGSTTAGADGNISKISLPGGLKTWISGIGVYYPDGKETQRIGIVPDIEVKPTIEGIRNGRDELLDKAIEVIMEEGR